MNFFQFLKSLDDLLYEVVSWLVFYPVTLWGTIRHPIGMMDYAAKELEQPLDKQFEAALSPPILLLLTVLLAHGLELALIGESTLIADTRGLAGLISDDTSLILLRLVAFATFPLILAVRTVRQQHVPLTRASLEKPFYAQCYANAPFAFLLSLSATFSQMSQGWIQWAAIGLTWLSVLAFIAVQTAWFRKELDVGIGRGLWNALVGYAGAIVFMIALGWLVGGGAW